MATPVFYEVPLSPLPQKLSISMAGTIYDLTILWNNFVGIWIMNLASQDGTKVLNSIPLVAGSDLLAQFAYMEFGGALTCQTDNDALAAPTFANLGLTAHLYFVPDA